MKRIVFIIFSTLLLYFVSLAQNGEVNSSCPSLKISSNSTVIEPNKPFAYFLEINNPNNYALEYNWKVKGAKILSGQGTEKIIVLPELKNDEIQIYIILTIDGLSAECKSEISEMTYACFLRSTPLLIEEYAEASFEENITSKVDEFLAKLSKEQDLRGFIEVIYKDNSELENHLKLITNHLTQNNSEINRIIFAVNKEKKSVTRFWLIPPATEYPVDKRYTIISAKEVIEKLKTLSK